MNWARIIKGTVVAGVVASVIDYGLYNFVAKDWFAGLAYVNTNPPMMWAIIGDFAAVFMFMLAWDKFSGAFGSGAGGGFKFGAAAGAFITFPATLFWQMNLTGFAYALAWKLIIVNIIWYGIVGVVAAMLDGKAA